VCVCVCVCLCVCTHRRKQILKYKIFINAMTGMEAGFVFYIAVLLQIQVFWDMTPCCTSRSQHFGGS